LVNFYQLFIVRKSRQLTYDSPFLYPLKRWIKENEDAVVDDEQVATKKDTPINSSLQLTLDMCQSKDVQLVRDLSIFVLPPIDYIGINYLSEATQEVKSFLTDSFRQTRILGLNWDGHLEDGSKWVKEIVKAFSKVEERVELRNFRFSKEEMEDIVDNSLHLDYLGICD
jgi:hypothetical protein